MFKGSTVALVTPFKDGKVDEDKIRELVEIQVKNGTSGILPCGTTGESPTLNHDEHNRVIEICIEATAGRVPVLAGTGSNSTAEAVALTQHAAKVKADAALVVTPYYNKPSQEGLYRHFKAVADSVDIPIILYNIAGRTSKNIETETVVRLANDCKNIIGVKEASGSLGQMQDVKLHCPEDFLLLSGDDNLTLPILSVGGVGVISVVANIIPADTAKVIQLFNEGKIDEARALHYKILPLVKAMFIDSNPVPVKYACELLGLCSSEVRLPLCETTEANKSKVKQALENYGVLS
ncbi:4-hydroxy-tetrahydrodipicolinate synthase [hydrothermal vent metagenome]|uniref:4-hydroxy-tetrahydrodipicolinate synthase n=1 Tax=hydrothermal vent metagenome TaxID=652676 RepID=A0A3B1DGF3_9ZZZZ